jgi:hypothetical protein
VHGLRVLPSSGLKVYAHLFLRLDFVRLTDAGLSCLKRFRQDANLLLALMIVGGSVASSTLSITLSIRMAVEPMNPTLRERASYIFARKGIIYLLIRPAIIPTLDLR